MALQNILTTVRTKGDPDRREKRGRLSIIERRRHPRFSIELPFDYFLFEDGEDHRGIMADASEGGLLAFLPERVGPGTLLRMEILISRGTELITIVAIARVVWSDLVAGEGRAKYRYGLQFLSFFQKDVDKLKVLLREVSRRH